MYGAVGRQTDDPEARDRYVEVVHAESAAARIARWFREVNPWVLDAIIGTIFTIVGLLALRSYGSDPKHVLNKPDALGVLLALGCSLPFYVRRRFPLTVLVSTTAFVVALACTGYPSNAQVQFLTVAAYTVGSHCENRRRVLGMAWLVLGMVTAAAIGIPDTSTANIATTGAIYFAAFFFGVAIRNRRLYMQQLEARAAMLERERDEEAKRAVADERLRIAQELHDVVAHSMGVIAVQAGVGAHVIDNDPAEAKKSLEAIATTSRSTLTEIRRLLGVLRADEAGEYQPAPGLADLDRLVADVDSAGLPVDVRIEGTRHDVPPGVDLTAYRIVQEALTNVLKHAGPAHAKVIVGYEPSALRLEIADDGRGVNGRATEGGHGLVGMRERVGVYGGTLEAGPVVGGGFRVRARLPYGEEE
jgi:signal transduction histidine kinase